MVNLSVVHVRLRQEAALESKRAARAAQLGRSADPHTNSLSGGMFGGGIGGGAAGGLSAGSGGVGDAGSNLALASFEDEYVQTIYSSTRLPDAILYTRVLE